MVQLSPPALQRWREVARSVWGWSATDRAWQIFLLAVVALSLWPIARLDVFPSQDGPSHLYNASLLLHYRDPFDYLVRQYLDTNPLFTPNILASVALAILLELFEPLVAEKLLVMLIAAGLPLALDYLAGSFDRRHRVFALIGLLYSQHHLLHMGFYNFSLAVPLTLLTCGYWVRHRGGLTTGSIATFLVLAVATYLAHFAAFAALMVLLATLTAHDLSLVAIRTAGERWLRRWPRLVGWLPDVGQRSLRSALGTSLVLTPVFAIGLCYAAATHSDNVRYWGLPFLRAHFWDYALLTSYTYWHTALTPWLWTLIAAALASGLLVRLWRRRLWDARDGLLLGVAVLLALYWTMPWAQNAGGWINDRLLIFVALLAALWCGSLPRWVALPFGAAALLLGVLQLNRLSDEYQALQPELREFVDGRNHIAPHSTVGVDVNDLVLTAFDTLPVLVIPLLHGPAYFGLRPDVVLLENYEADFGYFPFSWRFGKPQSNAADYLIEWTGDEKKRAENPHAERYDIVHSSAHLRLFRRKQPELAGSFWSTAADGRLAVEFRMGATAANNQAGWVGVGPADAFAPGRYGWLGPHKVLAGPNASKAPDIYRNHVYSEDPATFRVALPDGRYRVTDFFSGCCGGEHQVNVDVNGVPVVSALVQRGDETFRAIRFDVEVRDQLLDQSFYTNWENGNDGWLFAAWSLCGIRVEQISAYADDGGNLEVVGLPSMRPERKYFEPFAVKLISDRRAAEIHYTLDGAAPTARSERYRQPVLIEQPGPLRAQLFLGDRAIGEVTGFELPKPPEFKLVERSLASPGWRARYFEGDWTSLPRLSAMQAKSEESVAVLDAAFGERTRYYALEYSGFIDVTRAGRYTFWLVSDDGSQLRISDQVVVDNNGVHQRWANSASVDLEVGVYPIRIDYFQGAGSRDLHLWYRGPDMRRRQPIEQLLFKGESLAQ